MLKRLSLIILMDDQEIQFLNFTMDRYGNNLSMIIIIHKDLKQYFTRMVTNIKFMLREIV